MINELKIELQNLSFVIYRLDRPWQPDSPLLDALPIQNQKEYFFDSSLVEVVTVAAPASGSLAGLLPAGGKVARPFEARRINKRLQHSWFYTIAFPPVVRHGAGDEGKRMRCEIPHLDPRQNQEPGVAHHLLKVRLTRRVAPLNKFVVVFQTPRTSGSFLVSVFTETPIFP